MKKEESFVLFLFLCSEVMKAVACSSQDQKSIWHESKLIEYSNMGEKGPSKEITVGRGRISQSIQIVKTIKNSYLIMIYGIQSEKRTWVYKFIILTVCLI